MVPSTSAKTKSAGAIGGPGNSLLSKPSMKLLGKQENASLLTDGAAGAFLMAS